MEVESKAYRAEVKTLTKLAKVYGPQYVKGVDYSQPRAEGTSQIGSE